MDEASSKKVRHVPNTSLIIFDFDGTVALGDGPVRAYAHEAARAADDPGAFLERVRAQLAPRHTGADTPLDAYDVIRIVAEQQGLAPADLARAYLDSRALLGTDAAPVTAPAGLAEAVADLGAECMLVTNAPGIRIPETLSAIGLGDSFARVVTDARKPDGLARLLDEPATRDRRILAVGDIWRNDLAPAHRRGHDTALVGAYLDPAATPTFRAPTLAELLPQLKAWVAASDS